MATTEAAKADETTKTPAPAAPAAEQKSGKEYVKYTGSASRREITAEQFKSIGVEASKDYNWTFGNGFKLPKSDFSESALDYLLNETRAGGRRSFTIVTE